MDLVAHMIKIIKKSICGYIFVKKVWCVRFIFCRAVLSLYTPTSNKKEYLPDCSPALPNSVSPTHGAYKEAVHKIADIFGVAPMFNLPEPLQPKPSDV